MSVVQVAGQTVPAELLGELRDGSRWREDPAGLRNLMAEEGYLFVRQAIPAAVADRARHEILSRLAAVDEVDDPLGAGTFTGRSRRRELQPDLGAFWTSVSEGEAIRRATHGPELRGLLSALLAEPAQPHDYLFVRVGTPGKATGLHYDMPFFCRGSNRVHTVWLALGEVALDQGPLVVLEGSHHFDDLLEPIRRIDYDSVGSARVAAQQDAIAVARERRTRLLTAHFQPGDAIVFSMSLMHGALDYHAPHQRVRVSCDVRFQPVADAQDPRYFGPHPTGTTGVGYGELNGAKPLTEPWHVR